MTRLIERWFPCSEVSRAAATGWGHGKVEKTLFPWFAARPPAQAKAAVICSLLPWPDDIDEQKRIQALVTEAMQGRYAARFELQKLIRETNPDGAEVLDPFSGRGMIPLEAARLGLRSLAVDYSPIAVLASLALTDYPFRSWDSEPELPFESGQHALLDARPRLVRDVEITLQEVSRQYSASMQEFYPEAAGLHPWAYLWAVTLPCQDCGRRFPLVASYELRKPSVKKGRRGEPDFKDPGQSFFVKPDHKHGSFEVVVHDGPPREQPTLANLTKSDGTKIAGKSAKCIFCSHPHPVSLHRRLTDEGFGRDALLIVSDLDSRVGKSYRAASPAELTAAVAAGRALQEEPEFAPGIPAVPDERIAPGNNNIIGPSIYGVKSFGQYMNARQTLAFVRLARIIGAVGADLETAGLSREYVKALATYCVAVLVRKVRRSGRACTLDVKVQAAHDIYSNQGSIGYSYDFLEVGIGSGQGTWDSIAASEVSTLRNLMDGLPKGTPTDVTRGSATALSLRSSSIAAVVADPPYDEMLAYADSSDVMYVWAKRALHSLMPEIAISVDPHGAQEKQDEIIVKRVRGEAPGEHRTREHYDRRIVESFTEMARVVRPVGLVTIVFGSGDIEVWRRLLEGFQKAGLIMTASWPANTESGSHQGKANIQTTLTMSCRPAPSGRLPGRKGSVEAEIVAEIKRRYLDWERWGLAPADMLMAAAGPAMEVVGRYSNVLDAKGESVEIHKFLPLARAAVQSAMAVEVDHYPLETFDSRTRFALWWIRLYGRQVQAKSELRWQTLASSLEIADVRDLVNDVDGGIRFTSARAFKGRVGSESAVIDVVLALAAASDQGLGAMGEVISSSGRPADDVYLWAAIQFLADRLPDNDPDAIAFTRILRSRGGIATAAETAASAAEARFLRGEGGGDGQLTLL
ncbi:DUF1156 domain-containing protein [Cryptosporangium aurantiacum]|uniref:Adenine-specific DNA methylase, contains a Zn-ribbon domain n=1 Tax=Cryptosporangium aurantiacum TaxID=134849 RepID=A0A1M7RL82_9ACTN|nr:DUF1156 domain-containing protein [Cryptosporangium aurantiacum]SHN46911.1 Adenine-specific DNA methylase, contains a Zn-ribbon domain [Cryptosporangium aurantiacum]